MATKPKAMGEKEWAEHRAAALEATAARAAVEVDPVAALLALEERVTALEGGRTKKIAVEKK